MFTSGELVGKLVTRWKVNFSPERAKQQVEYANDLLKQYDGELIDYCIEHADRYTKGKSIYSMRYIPYIIAAAEKDWQREKSIPDVIAKSKEKRINELKQLNTQPAPKNIKFTKDKPQLRELDFSEIESIYDDLL